MSVALSTAVTEVSVALRTSHMVTSLCTLDMNLQTVEVVSFLAHTTLIHHIDKELHALSQCQAFFHSFSSGHNLKIIIMFSFQTQDRTRTTDLQYACSGTLNGSLLSGCCSREQSYYKLGIKFSSSQPLFQLNTA